MAAIVAAAAGAAAATSTADGTRGHCLIKCKCGHLSKQQSRLASRASDAGDGREMMNAVRYRYEPTS